MSGENSSKSKAEVWRERLEAQVRSRQTVRAFCAEQGLSLWGFHYWRRKFGIVRRKKGRSRFVAVVRPSAFGDSRPSLRIQLPNGVRIELGAGLESGAVREFLRGLCGVGSAPKDGDSAKP